MGCNCKKNTNKSLANRPTVVRHNTSSNNGRSNGRIIRRIIK